jgi:hypothetical protein
MKKFKLIVFAVGMAIASAVIMSSCTTENQRLRIERGIINKMELVQDSLDSIPVKVFCAQVVGYTNDSLVYSSTHYYRDSLDLAIAVDYDESTLRRYSITVDSTFISYWEIKAK